MEKIFKIIKATDETMKEDLGKGISFPSATSVLSQDK